jgi:hypothetical protein
VYLILSIFMEILFFYLNLFRFKQLGRKTKPWFIRIYRADKYHTSEGRTGLSSDYLKQRVFYFLLLINVVFLTEFPASSSPSSHHHPHPLRLPHPHCVGSLQKFILLLPFILTYKCLPLKDIPFRKLARIRNKHYIKGSLPEN